MIKFYIDIRVVLIRLAGNRLDSPVKQPAYQLTVSRYYQNRV